MWFQTKRYMCAFSILYVIVHVNCQDVLVEISQGILRGKTATNMDGGTFYSFQNIPYAEPPVNELRFKAPVAAHGWEGTRDATTDLPSCWQYSVPLSIFEGQEDCLYLNVFTPELPTNESTGKTVMVYIHGGAFTFGSSQSSLYGPEFLLLKDIVLVTLNYRLGIFGFFNLNDTELEVPGNAGMKDQVMALQWVKNNIEHFGGDPNKITIFGESAGSASVHLHMLSPMSTGVFHKVIGQSGTAIMPLVDGTINSGEVVAQQLGIQTDNWNEMLASLQEMSADELVNATRIIASTNQLFTTPIIEQLSNEPAFLSARPIDIMRSGNYNQVPYLTGTNSAEGLLLQVFSLQSNDENLFIEDFTYFVPNDFDITSGSEEEAEISQKIKEFYYGDTVPTIENATAAIALFGDYEFSFPAYRSVLEHLKTLSGPIYFYYFSADTELNYLKQLEPRIQDYPGAGHADDLGYLFTNVFTPSVIEKGGVEDLAIRNIVNLWTNFAIYGNPTPDDSYGFVWQPVTEDTFNYLHIDTNVTSSKVNPMPVNMQFWYDLYQQYFPIN